LHQDTLLAQELARTIYQFWRINRPNRSYQGVNQGEFMLLVHLKHFIEDDNNGIKVSDLSERLQITSAAVTQKINSLVKSNYVERLEDPTDRRVVLVKITSEGVEVLKRARSEHFEYIKGLVGFLGEQDSKELERLLSSVLVYAQERRNKTV
jgi:DNA-binding MarR family transcriptional regulator